MTVKKVKVGVVGSGNISWTYLNDLTRRFDIIDVVGCSDLIPEKSERRSKEFGIRQMTTEEIMADPEIEIICNITQPVHHYEVNKLAVEAGKSVYTEKMFCSTLAEAEEIYELAKTKPGVRLSAGPDTSLGAAIQTARKLIDDGYIGTPLQANAVIARGYHFAFPGLPDPTPFIFDRGGTLPYDMGSYYIHALIWLLGGVKRVTGFARPYENKTYMHPFNPKYGEKLELPTSSMLSAALEFDCGAYGSLVCLGESFMPETSRIEIYGTDGTLIVPDPNCYDGPVKLLRNGDTRFLEVPLTHSYGNPIPAAPREPGAPRPTEAEQWNRSYRGIGIADMAWAIRNNRPHRCAVEIGLQALEIVEACTEIAKTGSAVHVMKHTVEKPKALRPGFVGGNKEAVFDD